MPSIAVSQDEFHLGLCEGKGELSDIVRTIAGKVESRQTPIEDARQVKRTLDIFIGSYYALERKLEKNQVLKNEPNRKEALWNYALSCAASAATNYLEDLLQEDVVLHTRFNYANGKPQKSKYSTIANALSGLRSVATIHRNNPSLLAITAQYYAELEQVAGALARKKCTDDGFNELVAITPQSNAKNVSFALKQRTKQTQKIETNGDVVPQQDKLPSSLPQYIASNVSLDMVVGNKEQIAILLEYAVSALHYHPTTGENFLWDNGNGFPEGMLLYGDPGVGKTYLAAAIMNEACRIAEQRNLQFLPVEMSGKDIGSIYQNRPGVLLEHYFSMLREGDRAHIVLMDEFDDFVPMGANGKFSENARQRLSAFKRVTGNSRAKGNYFIMAIANRISSKEDIPDELHDRFKPIYIPGPQTPEEYGQIMQLCVGIKERLGLVDPDINWYGIGEHLIQWKQKIAGIADEELNLGRGFKKIAQDFSMTTEQPKIAYINQTIGRDPAFHREFYQDKLLRVTQASVVQAIDKVMGELIQTKMGNKPGQYGVTPKLS